jgi:2-C-methyl-D-erythritol 4-phosphate cytidylyltransferase
MLKVAYSKDYHDGITDDASLIEEAGFSIHLVQGNEENLKVTTALDLEWLHFLMTKS